MPEDKNIFGKPLFTPAIAQSLEITECNEDCEICSRCAGGLGGACCRSMGCEIFPQDVKKWFKTDTITTEILCAMLKSGKVQLDWWEGDIRHYFGYRPEQWHDPDYLMNTFYFHMRVKGNNIVQGSYGGECCMLTPTGCSIPWDLRPLGGRALAPSKTPINPNNPCSSIASKPECAMAWLPYNDMLEDIVMNRREYGLSNISVD